jgi:hypothetical protein
MNFVQLLYAVLGTCNESKSGVSSGILYAGLMCAGVSFASYTEAVAAMTRDGLITQSNNLLIITEKGSQLISLMETKIASANVQPPAELM